MGWLLFEKIKIKKLKISVDISLKILYYIKVGFERQQNNQIIKSSRRGSVW